MFVKQSVVLAAFSALAAAGPVFRQITELDQAAFQEAQQRDETANRAVANGYLQTADGRCVFIDELSGDNRANLTPLQVAACKSTKGQGFDVLTSGKHMTAGNGSALVVSTLTSACLTVDPRREAGNQVIMFSCGGRADGSGTVTDSQMFAFTSTSQVLQLKPANMPGSCLTVSGNVLDIATCDSRNRLQRFLFGGVTSDTDGEIVVPEGSPAATTSTPAATTPAASTLTTILGTTTLAPGNGTAPATQSAPFPTPNNGTTSALPGATGTASPGKEVEQGTGQKETVTTTVTEKPDATTVFVTVTPPSVADKTAASPSQSTTTTVYVTAGREGLRGGGAARTTVPAAIQTPGLSAGNRDILDVLKSLIGN